MAYNHGQPLLNGIDVSTHVQAFLNHPYALDTDSRTVASCELLYLRCTWAIRASAEQQYRSIRSFCREMKRISIER